ncbi:MAG: arylsulfatase [Methylotetracoccus sp.]
MRNRVWLRVTGFLIVGFHGLLVAAPATPSKNTGSTLDRTVLPIPEPKYPAITTLDARNAKAPPRFEIKAPDGAPNVVIVLLDDMGFAVPGTFGGPVPMPTLDRLAQGGLRYNNFHTTALCSPTRQALKTGRNHHTGNTGSIMETATAFPGDTGVLPGSVAPLAEILRHNGYSTAAFGKWHETAPWEISVSGPYTRWPTLQGFDKFYGFLGGETNQWAPSLYDGVTKVEAPSRPGYHFTVDMTDQAIAWVRYQQALTPERPFFIYYAPGATHAPHHVPKEWADKYRNRFDAGWDRLREETLKRQIQMGIVPPGTPLASKPEAIRDWDTLSADEKRLFARQAEVYAGFAEHTDHEVGRLVDALAALGELDNTLFVYIAGDNGASAEGGMSGMFSEGTYFNGVQETVEDQLKHLEQWGGPETYPHMAAGWAVAFDTPFRWTKQVAADFGGTRNGMVVHWPKRVQAKNGLRSQFHHVIDIAPTVLEAAHLPEPRVVNGVKQAPFEGVSLGYTFDDPNAKDRHLTQYFEIFGNRALYHDGWLAGTVHRAPWEPTARHPLEHDVWELYDVRHDFSLSRDLAKDNPKKLAEMQKRFLAEAVKYNVLPLDDRFLERLSASAVGRPDVMAGRTSLTLAEGMIGMMENVFIDVKNRSLSITADVEIPEGGAQGVILAQGGRFGGWSLYVKDGKPAYTYNFLGLEQFTVMAPQPLPAGKTTLVLDFQYDGGGVGKGGTGVLSANGQKLAEGRIEHTQPRIFSADETADVGMDDATPVVSGIGEGRATRFTGKIDKITVEVR